MQIIFKVRNCNAGKCTGIHLHLFKILVHCSDYASTSDLPYTVLCCVSNALFPTETGLISLEMRIHVC